MADDELAARIRSLEAERLRPIPAAPGLHGDLWALLAEIDDALDEGPDP